MPNYDVQCSKCGYEDIAVIKIADLASWDLGSVCPQCQHKEGAYHRVIKQAALINVGEKSQRRSTSSQKKVPLSPGTLDDMKHQQWRTQDSSQIEEARAIVKSGKYEGF